MLDLLEGRLSEASLKLFPTLSKAALMHGHETMGSTAAPFAGSGERLRLALRGALAGDADLLALRGERDLDTERLALRAERERLTGDLDLDADLLAGQGVRPPSCQGFVAMQASVPDWHSPKQLYIKTTFHHLHGGQSNISGLGQSFSQPLDFVLVWLPHVVCPRFRVQRCLTL